MMPRASSLTGLLALALAWSAIACGGGGRRAQTTSTPSPSGMITPVPAPDPGPPPAEVLDTLASGGGAARTCFAWAASGAVMCAVNASSTQAGATFSVDVVGAERESFVYYQHPDDQQFFDLEPTRIDRAALVQAKAAAVAGDFQGWGGPDVALKAGDAVEVGGHALRRTRTVTGEDGDATTGTWSLSRDVIELRCGDRWVPVPLEGEVFGNRLAAPDTQVVVLGRALLVTARVSWAIEGDHGGGSDAARIDPAALCR